MIFQDRVLAKAGDAADSTALPSAAGQATSRRDQLNDVTRVMREFLPAQDFEAIRETVEDWVERAPPRVELKDSHIYMMACGARDLEHIRLARNEYRRRHIEEEALREVVEAAALGRRLLSDPCGHACVVGPAPSSQRGKRNSSPAVVDETTGPAPLVERLESTAAGCRWLLERWDEIRAFFEPGTRWISEDSFKMLRLMGRRPRDVLESSEVAEVFLASHALDRRGRNPFMPLRGEVTLDEVNDLERGLGPREIDARSQRCRAGTPNADRDRGAPIAGLKAKAEEHEQRAAGDQARNAAERTFDTSPQGLELERFERDCTRRVKQWLVTLQTLRQRETSVRQGEK